MDNIRTKETPTQSQELKAILERAEKEAKILKNYDDQTVAMIGDLSKGGVGAEEFMTKIDALVKSRDKELENAGAVPLKAPKCVGTTWKTAIGRQGVN
jgi:3-deoxy-D-arabino-heptulosonate 7-phosphate (DAHP) synthase